MTGLWRLLEQAVRWARLATPLLALLATMALCLPARGETAAPAAGPGGSAAAGAPAPPGPRPLPPIPGAGKVTVVAISGTIDLGLSPFLERVVAAQGEGDLLVLDISTLGGRIDAALAIRDALLRARARTVCWVNPRAISAGALISLACDVIAVAPGATLGAATPVQIGEGGEMKPVAEKVVSYMRKEMRATAEAKGRRGDIAEAMVDADVEVPGLDEKRSCSRWTARRRSRGASPRCRPAARQTSSAPWAAPSPRRSPARAPASPRSSRASSRIPRSPGSS